MWKYEETCNFGFFPWPQKFYTYIQCFYYQFDCETIVMKLQILKEYFLHLFIGQRIDPAIDINFTFLIKQMIWYLSISLSLMSFDNML